MQGKSYVDAVEVVTEEAGNAVVDADSAVLIKAREKLEYQDRLKEVDEHNKILSPCTVYSEMPDRFR